MTGFSEMVLSTFDLDRSANPLVEIGGWSRTDLPPVSTSQLAAWGLPPDTRCEQALLTAPDDTKGALRLVCFDVAGQVLMRPSQRAWDTGGIFDVDIFTRDARSVYRRLERMGWTALGEPVDYKMGTFDVTEVVATGPDGFVIALIEPRQEVTFDIAFGAMSRIFNSTQIVRDMDASLAFYRDVLGWSTMMDLAVDDAVEPGADTLGLPMPFARNARRRVAIVHPDGGNDGSVELIAIEGWEGHDYAERAAAPNIGLLSLRFPVADAAALAARVAAAGWPLCRPIADVEYAPGTVAPMFSVRTPDGALLEFYESTDSTVG